MLTLTSLPWTLGGMPPRPHTPRASRVDTVQIVLPGLTNTHGTIFGGIMMLSLIQIWLISGRKDA